MDGAHPESMHVKTPWGIAILPLIGVPFAILGVWGGLRQGELVFTGIAVVGIFVLPLAARRAIYPRLAITPQWLEFPRDFLTMKPQQVRWAEILSAEFTLQSGFFWPVLVLSVRGRSKPLEIPFPMVDKERRGQAMALIQHYVTQAERPARTPQLDQLDPG